MGYKFERNNKGLHFAFESDKLLENGLALRLGPFDKKPNLTAVDVNIIAKKHITKSGDSYWVNINTNVGLKTLLVSIDSKK